jgi:hypothetical protein
VKWTSAKLIGRTYQFVPFTVIAWPISAAQPMAGFLQPHALYVELAQLGARVLPPTEDIPV